jgi:hypothetical protein
MTLRSISMPQKSRGAVGGAVTGPKTQSETLLSRQEVMTQMFQKTVKKIEDVAKEKEREKTEMRKDRAEFVFVEHDDEAEWTSVSQYPLGTLDTEEHVDDSEWLEVEV